MCYACIRARTVRDRILKFYMWNKYEYLEDLYVFSSFPSDLSLQSNNPFSMFFFFFFFFFFFDFPIVSLWNLVNKIAQEPLEQGS